MDYCAFLANNLLPGLQLPDLMSLYCGALHIMALYTSSDYHYAYMTYGPYTLIIIHELLIPSQNSFVFKSENVIPLFLLHSSDMFLY